MTEKKKPKRKSMTAIIRNLRLRIDEVGQRNGHLYNTNRKLRQELNQLRNLLPLKYFKVDFKIKSNDGHIVPSSEVLSAYSAELAIEEVKRCKTHPDTFELTDIKKLA